MIRTTNIPEQIVAADLERDGYEVLKNGWPDFVAVDWKNKKVRFVEVKPFTKCLKPRQITMKNVFDLLGLDYEVWFVEDCHPPVIYKGTKRHPSNPRPTERALERPMLEQGVIPETSKG